MENPNDISLTKVKPGRLTELNEAPQCQGLRLWFLTVLRISLLRFKIWLSTMPLKLCSSQERGRISKEGRCVPSIKGMPMVLHASLLFYALTRTLPYVDPRSKAEREMRF